MTTKSTLVATLGTAVLAGTLSMSSLAASIVSFNGPAGEAYIGKFIKGIKATAAYKLRPQQCLMLEDGKSATAPLDIYLP